MRYLRIAGAVIGLIAIILLLIFLIGGEPPECEIDADCVREHFTGTCADDNCTWEPILDECGNKICETGENECTCAVDCGVCAGSVAGAPLLTKRCDANKICATDLKGAQETKTHQPSLPLNAAGDKFGINTNILSPFNVKTDKIYIEIYPDQIDEKHLNRRLTSIIIQGRGENKQTIRLASLNLDRPVCGEGPDYVINAEIPLDFTTSKIQENVDNLKMTIGYEYDYKYGTDIKKQTQTIVNPLSGLKMTYVVPTASYTCDNCDDDNVGTEDSCDNGLCKNTPKPNTCGNYVCETGENSCNCEIDCCSCARETENLQYACQASQCIAGVLPGKEGTPETKITQITDPAKMDAKLTYYKPFNINEHAFEITFEASSFPTGVSNIKVKKIQVKEGTSLRGEVTQEFSINTGSPTTIMVPVSNIPSTEYEALFNLVVTFTYTRNGNPAQATRRLDVGERIWYLNP